MSQPTAYDLTQDTRIKGVEDLVQTSYQPFQGPEFSYPVVHQPMDDEMWQQVTLGIGDGILDDDGGPYYASVSDTTDTITIRPSSESGRARAILKGFYHEMRQPVTLSLPPVSTATVYHVGLVYDPLRHKEPGGPIRLEVWKGAGDFSSGRRPLEFYEIPRQPSQLLSAAWANRKSKRRMVSPAQIAGSAEALPEFQHVIWGTRVLCLDTMEWWRADSSGWINMTNPPWRPITLHGSWEIMGNQPEYRIVRGRIEMQGRAIKKDGRTISTSGPETVGWISGLDLGPWRAFISATTGTGVARLESGQGSGAYDNILASASPGSKWVDFSCMRFELRKS